jgi:hypothetical protein
MLHRNERGRPVHTDEVASWKSIHSFVFSSSFTTTSPMPGESNRRHEWTGALELNQAVAAGEVP